MARRISAASSVSSLGITVNRSNLRPIPESSTNASQDEQKTQMYLDRHRLLSSKGERCVEELIERVYKRNSSLNFELLAPPSSHASTYLPSEPKEYHFDFYLVWKNSGKIHVERDASSVCCQIKYLDDINRWSRAEQHRLLISNLPKKKRFYYLNGRGIRDLFYETLYEISPDLIRLDFIEHIIYFDLIIPLAQEKSICHITLIPCIHLVEENEVLLPYGTLRWYPRSLLPCRPAIITFQQPLQNLTVRRYVSTTTTGTIDEKAKISKKDQEEFARIRTIIHEFLLPCTLEHIEHIEHIQKPFENENRTKFFLPHATDGNFNVFPAGQYLLQNDKAKQFFKDFLEINIKQVNAIDRQ